jgi:hypothetical protein
VKKKGKEVYTKRLGIKSVSVSGTGLTLIINLSKAYKGGVQVTILPGLASADGSATTQPFTVIIP